MTAWIAERHLIAEVRLTGERKNFTIRVGKPRWIEGEEFATCPIEWDGLFDRIADAKGVDLLQAIQQASNIDPMLKMLDGKYRFYYPSGESYFDDAE